MGEPNLEGDRIGGLDAHKPAIIELSGALTLSRRPHAVSHGPVQLSTRWSQEAEGEISLSRFSPWRGCHGPYSVYPVQRGSDRRLIDFGSRSDSALLAFPRHGPLHRYHSHPHRDRDPRH